jgi:mRNA-degrading endonuclease RelE of RelBE toxin-antitoxin system
VGEGQTAAQWQISRIGKSAKKLLKSLSPAHQELVLERLTTQPKPQPGAVPWQDHLKGRWDCNWEYQDLPNGKRLIYRVNDDEHTVELLAGGPHDML